MRSRAVYVIVQGARVVLQPFTRALTSAVLDCRPTPLCLRDVLQMDSTPDSRVVLCTRSRRAFVSVLMEIGGDLRLSAGTGLDCVFVKMVLARRAKRNPSDDAGVY